MDDTAFDPVARVMELALPTPSLSDNRSHEARLREALARELGARPALPLAACRELAAVLPRHGYRVQVAVVDGPCGWEVAWAAPPGAEARALGLAVDLGSTTVVFYLVDLRDGEVLGVASHPNPQAAHGEDILSRIHFAGRGDGLRVLQREVVSLFNEAMRSLAAEAGGEPADILYTAVAGNTTMCHFLLGLDPGHICREPYLPAAGGFDLVRPGELGLEAHPGGWVYCFPNTGSY
ncbi:ATP-binding protein, partial [Dissulfurirhabdus thermomarina]|nr:ATP-binding protein [Dissulfurirhabdus thermomarina]